MLRQTPLIDSYIGSDLTLLGELGLHGRIADVPAVLFWRREHSNTSTKGVYKVRRNRLQWFNSKKTPVTNMPEWRLNSELVRSVLRTRKIHGHSIPCIRAILKRIWLKRRLLVEDIVFAAKDIVVAFVVTPVSKLRASRINESSSM